MQRRQFLSTLMAGAAALPFLQSCTTASKKPNVLLILTDDQGWGDVSSHGNPVVDTPMMDRIAAEGARLDRFYVSPVCAPTRASLMSGRYHLRCGVHGVTRGRETMRAEEVTLAEILHQNGYATAAFGKWHNGAHFPQHPNGQGFDQFVGFCSGHWNNYFDTDLEENGKPISSKGYIADYFTDRALEFIDANHEKPFFCYVPYNPPHSPFQVADSYFDKYKAKGLDDKLACVYAMCENLDDNIGRLLSRLEEYQILDDTIVVFITDNGPNGSRYNGEMRGSKGSPHEGGSRVPCFIRWPQVIKAGTVVEPIAAHIDVLPTLVDLLDLPRPQTLPLDGKSLVPLLKNPQADWPDRKLFGHWSWAGSVRTQQYRLVVKGEENVELYDMLADPSETKNIAGQKTDVYDELVKAYRDWWNDVTKDGLQTPPIEIGHAEMPNVILPGHEAYLHPDIGKGISYKVQQGWANDWVTNWTDTDSYPYWNVQVVEAGEYELSMDYICAQENINVPFRVEIGNVVVNSKVSQAHNPEHLPSPDRVVRKEVYEKVWKTLPLGRIQLKPGEQKIKIRVLDIPGKMAMDVKNLKLSKV